MRQKCYINLESDIIFPLSHINRHVKLSGKGLFKALGKYRKEIRQIANDDGIQTERGLGLIVGTSQEASKNRRCLQWDFKNTPKGYIFPTPS
jgi:hypothetical protein